MIQVAPVSFLAGLGVVILLLVMVFGVRGGVGREDAGAGVKKSFDWLGILRDKSTDAATAGLVDPAAEQFGLIHCKWIRTGRQGKGRRCAVECHISESTSKYIQVLVAYFIRQSCFS